MDPTQKQSMKFGSHAVTVIPHYTTRLKDGTDIAMRAWFPSSTLVGTCFDDSPCRVISTGNIHQSYNILESPVPCIIEYIPYRKSDHLAVRDHRRHSWFCSHGYVSLRIDMRGSGESTGLCHDECLPQEQADAIELIDWLACQPWCNGSVGMMGKSWGGLNSLQVAYHQPNPLKAVISGYSTDNRYTDDIHYMDGCVLGNTLLSWSTTMFAWNAMPPSPIYMNNWESEWLHRLNKSCQPWSSIWLSHPLWDEYWQQGSVCVDYARVKCPVLAIGGWWDANRNSVPRLAENMPVCRSVIGPWPHTFPDDATGFPGPQSDYLNECLQWFDHHLKGKETFSLEVPKHRLYLCSGPPPSGLGEGGQRGKWVGLDSLPKMKSFYLDNASGKVFESPGNVVQLNTKAVGCWEITGCYGGEWYTISEMEESASDQRLANAHSICWTSKPLQEDVAIAGFPTVNVCVSIEGDTRGIIAVRFVDNLPNGEAHLISFGLLNLAHRNGHSEAAVAPVEPGKKYYVKVPMKNCCYVIKKGHKMIVGISPSYWPMVWPSRKNITLNVTTGCGDQPGLLELPVLDEAKANYYFKEDYFTHLLAPAICGPILNHTVTRPSSYSRNVNHDMANKVITISATSDEGRTVLDDDGGIFDAVYKHRFLIKEGDPLSATAEHDFTVKLETTESPASPAIKTCIRAIQKMTCDLDNFYVSSQLRASLDGIDVYNHTWSDNFKRVFN